MSKVRITIDVEESNVAAFQAMLDRDFYSGIYLEADQARKADREGQVTSLKAVLECARGHSSSSKVCASVLASLYNGYRFQVDLTELRLLDIAHLEHVLNVLRLDNSPTREVHEYFDNGGDIWERMIEYWNLEKDDQQ